MIKNAYRRMWSLRKRCHPRARNALFLQENLAFLHRGSTFPLPWYVELDPRSRGASFL